jgi:hypothetical protein
MAGRVREETPSSETIGAASFMRVLLSCARIRVVGMNVHSPDDEKGNKRRRPKTSRRVTVFLDTELLC